MKTYIIIYKNPIFAVRQIRADYMTVNGSVIALHRKAPAGRPEFEDFVVAVLNMQPLESVIAEEDAPGIAHKDCGMTQKDHDQIKREVQRVLDGRVEGEDAKAGHAHLAEIALGLLRRIPIEEPR